MVQKIVFFRVFVFVLPVRPWPVLAHLSMTSHVVVRRCCAGVRGRDTKVGQWDGKRGGDGGGHHSVAGKVGSGSFWLRKVAWRLVEHRSQSAWIKEHRWD